MIVQVALWLGFGLFGPCGVVTAVSITAALVYTLP